MWYYFDDKINGTKINFSNILLDKKLYKNILIYNMLYKTPTGPKPLRIRFDKVDGFIIFLDGKIKHLILFNYGLFSKICDKIKYLISTETGIRNTITHNLGRSELIHIILFKKILTFHNVVIHIKLVVSKNKNKC